MSVNFVNIWIHAIPILVHVVKMVAIARWAITTEYLYFVAIVPSALPNRCVKFASRAHAIRRHVKMVVRAYWNHSENMFAHVHKDIQVRKCVKIAQDQQQIGAWGIERERKFQRKQWKCTQRNSQTYIQRRSFRFAFPLCLLGQFIFNKFSEVFILSLGSWFHFRRSLQLSSLILLVRFRRILWETKSLRIVTMSKRRHMHFAARWKL